MKDPVTKGGGAATHLQLERHIALRGLLRTGGGSAAGLAAQLGVGERTVRRDLEFARDRLDWPVRYDPRLRRWALDGDPPALPALPLSQAELMALLVGARAMAAYQGTPYHAALQSGFGKILLALDATSAVTFDGTEALPVFELDPTREVDPTLFGRLLTACQRRERLEMTYHSLERDEVNVRQVDPYTLLNHSGDWYLVGYCRWRRKVLTFAVGERMLTLRETGVRFEPDPAFDLRSHLRSGFGIFKGGEPVDVVLEFGPEQARYMREKVWVEGETREELPDGRLVLRFRVPVSTGLRQFILRYGAAVTVRAPESLRRGIGEELGRAVAGYEAGANPITPEAAVPGQGAV